MDSILVVVYSWSGNSRRVAQWLAARHGWPVAEIADAHPRSYFRSLLDSLLRRHPAIRYEGPDPGDFRTVVLVSPIWAWRLAGPMRSFVTQHKEALQRVAVASTMGGAGASNAVQEVGAIIGGAPILAEAFLEGRIRDGSARAQVEAFGDALLPGSAQAQVTRTPAWTPHEGVPRQS